MILATILWMIAFWLQQLDHDLFTISTAEELINLHDTVSSPQHRTKVEISCVLLWISFPLLLAAIHGIKKLANVAFNDTPGY